MTDDRKKNMNTLSADDNRFITKRMEKTGLGSSKSFSGIVPICCHCNRIRDLDGTWLEPGENVTVHKNAKLSHTFCPECAVLLFPDYIRAKN